MAKVILDTDLYIDWINAGLHQDIVLAHPVVRTMSTIVLMELRAGAHTQRDQRLVQRLHDVFLRTGRLLAPSARTFWEAGRVLMRLQRDQGIELRKATRLMNDVLIAPSSLDIGAAVLTRNAMDFQMIRRVRGFDLKIISTTT